MLVNALSMMAPYGPAEKQALLEAPDLKTRAETLIAITEMALAREHGRFRIKPAIAGVRHEPMDARWPTDAIEDRPEAAGTAGLPADQGAAQMGRGAAGTDLAAPPGSPIRCATASRSCCPPRRAPLAAEGGRTAPLRARTVHQMVRTNHLPGYAVCDHLGWRMCDRRPLK